MLYPKDENLRSNLSDSSSPRISGFNRMDTRTLKEHVAQALRDALFSGKIQAGERLNETKLAKDLGVSRLPIREALQQLQEQGLVVNNSRRGRFVISLSDEEIQKINGLRLILESEALKLCRANLSPEGLSALTSSVEKMEKSLVAPEIEAARLDLDFHRTIWSNSGNELLAKTLDGITIPLFAHLVLWRIRQDRPGWAAVLAKRHRMFLEFLQGSTEASAEQVVLDHLRYRYSEPERFSSWGLRSVVKAEPEENVAEALVGTDDNHV
jgi:DNA-binding GntR family transcriptional regulator